MGCSPEQHVVMGRHNSHTHDPATLSLYNRLTKISSCILDHTHTVDATNRALQKAA